MLAVIAIIILILILILSLILILAVSEEVVADPRHGRPGQGFLLESLITKSKLLRRIIR